MLPETPRIFSLPGSITLVLVPDKSVNWTDDPMLGFDGKDSVKLAVNT